MDKMLVPNLSTIQRYIPLWLGSCSNLLLSEGVQGARVCSTELRMVGDEVHGIRYCILWQNNLQISCMETHTQSITQVKKLVNSCDCLHYKMHYLSKILSV